MYPIYVLPRHLANSEKKLALGVFGRKVRAKK